MDKFLIKFDEYRPFDDNLSVGDFNVNKFIGESNFGKIYKVTFKGDTNLLKNVSIKNASLKIMPETELLRKGMIDKPTNEAKMIYALDSTFLVKFYGSFHDIDDLCLVIEYLPRNLFNVLRKRMYFGESAVRYISSHIVKGLSYLHSNMIVFRDLKPENLLIDKNWIVKLGDFSVSKLIKSRTYSYLGTLEYMAPEMIKNEGYGLSVDWWSFGVLLFELCAGFSPFQTSYQTKIMKKIVTGNYRFPVHFSEELKDLIRHLLKVEISKRYGCLLHRENDIKNHLWYEDDVNWEADINMIFVPKELREIEEKEGREFYYETDSDVGGEIMADI